MAEFWQAHGNWFIYGALFLLMIGHHLFMGRGHSDGGHEGHRHGSPEGTAAEEPPARRRSGGCH